jgi:hypothetical protein
MVMSNRVHEYSILFRRTACACLYHFVLLLHGLKGHAVAQWLRHCATNRKVTGSIPDGVTGFLIDIIQRFSNFFQVGTTFISQNVLQTTLLLSPLKANLSFF